MRLLVMLFLLLVLLKNSYSAEAIICSRLDSIFLRTDIGRLFDLHKSGSVGMERKNQLYEMRFIGKTAFKKRINAAIFPRYYIGRSTKVFDLDSGNYLICREKTAAFAGKSYKNPLVFTVCNNDNEKIITVSRYPHSNRLFIETWSEEVGGFNRVRRFLSIRFNHDTVVIDGEMKTELEKGSNIHYETTTIDSGAIIYNIYSKKLSVFDSLLNENVNHPLTALIEKSSNRFQNINCFIGHPSLPFVVALVTIRESVFPENIPGEWQYSAFCWSDSLQQINIDEKCTKLLAQAAIEKEFLGPLSFSPDGRWLICKVLRKNTRYDIFAAFPIIAHPPFIGDTVIISNETNDFVNDPNSYGWTTNPRSFIFTIGYPEGEHLFRWNLDEALKKGKRIKGSSE